MKKQTVVVLWSLAILVLVGGCCGWYIYRGLREKGEERGTEVFSCLPADIVAYSVSGGGAEDSYTLEKRDGKWQFEDGGAAVADAAKVETLINAASRITALKRISEAERRQFKTAAGTAEKLFVLKLKDGSEFRAEFLGTVKGSSAFSVNTDENIYTMNTSLRDMLTPTKEKLAVTSIFDGGTLLGIKYTEPSGKALEIKRERDGDGNAGYAVTKPYKIRGDYEKAEQLAESDIPNISIVKFIENPSENMENYGLDEASRAVLTVEMNADVQKEDTESTEETENVKKTIVLYLGKSDGGAVYAMKDGETGVFMINAGPAELLRAELSEMNELEQADNDAEPEE